MISSCTATPVLSLPSVSEQCIPAGSSMVSLMWGEVAATNTNGQTVTCTDFDKGANVSLKGGNFAVGMHTVNCSVTANNTDGQNVTCWDSVGGGNVPLTGRHFGVGLHTVNCSVTNDGNCTGTGSFTFTVTGK